MFALGKISETTKGKITVPTEGVTDPGRRSDS